MRQKQHIGTLTKKEKNYRQHQATPMPKMLGILKIEKFTIDLRKNKR
jgi:hypothetical protein